MTWLDAGADLKDFIDEDPRDLWSADEILLEVDFWLTFEDFLTLFSTLGSNLKLKSSYFSISTYKQIAFLGSRNKL